MAIPQISGPGSISQPTQTKRSDPPAKPASEPSSPRPDREQVQEVVRQLQRVAEPVAQNLQFMVDGETGKTVIRVVDGATKEVIRQIPNEEVLAIARAMDRLQGLLLKGKA
ncbi:MAG: flagellar protein FlaG [Burkholderiales bacterium]|nr:flagellar protein FlaG [Burkholderiales bacterium]MCZ2421495.1 flagellar protein FlaG [Burkholderiales bacterium]